MCSSSSSDFAISILLSAYNIEEYYVCVRGGPNQPLHRDPQWSIVLLKSTIFGV
jgi:hypothetical protein